MTSLLTDTISATSSGTATQRVVIQGYEGAFHEIAARLYHGEKAIEIVPAHTFDELVDVTERAERADMALMAIENTVAGSIMSNYNLLSEAKLRIVGEIYLRIKQNLMVLPGVALEDLEEVHSHYMAIAQCRNFLRQYPHIRLVETADTALSARNVRDKQWKNVGAIASTLAADMYGLDIIGASIETNKKNYTRFLVLEPRSDKPFPEEADKVSLCFSSKHEVGHLQKILNVLAAYDANLTKIQSTPIIGKPWEYRFFVDFVMGKGYSPQQAIAAIEPLTKELNIMGIYGKGIEYEY
ncbi:MAG: prephenate dehydratase [Bacteroidota bacterium]